MLTRTAPPDELVAYFAGDAPYRPGKAHAVCVATGVPEPEWHHVNRNPAEPWITNFVPLRRSLNLRIGGRNIPLDIGHTSLPAELEPTTLLSMGKIWLGSWRPTDAYGAANLADSMVCLHYGGNRTLRLECLLDALRYSRQAFSPEILKELYESRVLGLLNSQFSRSNLIRILMDLETTYAYVGAAEEANELALLLKTIRGRAAQKDRSYDRAARRLAHHIGVINPRQGLYMLEPIADSATTVDQHADVANSRAHMSLAQDDIRCIKAAHQLLESNIETYRFGGKSGDIAPQNMLLSSVIAELWQSTLTGVCVGDSRTVEKSLRTLEALMHAEKGRQRMHPPYLSPPPRPSAYIDILKAQSSPLAEKAYAFCVRVQQPLAPNGLLAALRACEQRALNLLGNHRAGKH